MKSINNFIGLALLSGALLTSCSDSFLQRDSLTESSSNTFWQTPDDALMALASCYDALQSNQLYNSCLLYTSPSPRDRQKSRMPSSA